MRCLAMVIIQVAWVMRKDVLRLKRRDLSLNKLHHTYMWNRVHLNIRKTAKHRWLKSKNSKRTVDIICKLHIGRTI